jgi:dihydropteroate synthase
VGRPEIIVEQALRERGAALMGVLNLTPDSFYDGGRYLAPKAAHERVDELVAQGADILDIGGESTRPRSNPIPAEEQIARISEALEYALRSGVLVSVDTSHPAVAAHALRAGAHLINDVTCLRNPELAGVVGEFGASLIVMHARGSMQDMPGFSAYPDAGYPNLVEDVRREWRHARDQAIRAGVPAERIWFDPGIGYNKNARHSFELLARLDEFRSEGVPIVVGASRKSFIASVDESQPEERLGGSIAASLSAVAHGASVLRVHDVRELRQALAVTRAVRAAASTESSHA